MRQHCSRVVISIDGTRAAHDEYRTDAHAKGTHDLVSRNLLALVQEGIRCVASVTVHPRFSSKVLENVRYLHELGVAEIDVGPAYGTVVWTEADGQALARSLEGIGLYLREVNDKGARLEVGPIYRESEHVDERLSDCWGCHAASTNLAFLPSGHIAGCSALAMLVSNFPALVLGHVSTGLCDEAVDQLLQLAQARGDQRSACQHCGAAANCTGGCLAINYATSGSALTPPGFYCQTISMIPKAWRLAWDARLPTGCASEAALNEI
jgi:radical SAM protein with 4Fe4S-binding SPASM domain